MRNIDIEFLMDKNQVRDDIYVIDNPEECKLKPEHLIGKLHSEADTRLENGTYNVYMRHGRTYLYQLERVKQLEILWD